MAATVQISERVQGGGRAFDPTTGAIQSISSGVLPCPDRTWNLPYGTASGQANQWYAARRTVAATTADDLDLAGGLTNPVTGTVTLVKVKRVLIRLVSPDGTAKLRIGPRGVTGAAQLWFQNVTANFYDEVFEELDVKNKYTGWTLVPGTTDILGIYNPTASPITYFIWVIGVQ